MYPALFFSLSSCLFLTQLFALDFFASASDKSFNEKVTETGTEEYVKSAVVLEEAAPAAATKAAKTTAATAVTTVKTAAITTQAAHQ